MNNNRNIEITSNGNKFTIILPHDKYYDEIYIKPKEKKVNYEPNKCYIEINNNITSTDVLKIVSDTIRRLQNFQKVYTGDIKKIKITFLTNEELGKKLVNESPIKEFFDVQIKEEQAFPIHTRPPQEQTTQLSQKVDTMLQFNKITKFDNGKMKTYIERSKDSNSTSYMIEGVDFSYFDTELESMSFEEKGDLSQKDAQEVANILIDRISAKYNLKRYYMRSAQEQSATNREEEATKRGVEKNSDAKGNLEIGVRKNDELSPEAGQIVATEQVGDKLQEVAAQTDSINITNGSSLSSGTSVENYSSTNPDENDSEIQIDGEQQVQVNSEQQRESLKVYYIQGEDILELVEGEFKQIGTLYTDGYYTSEEGTLYHYNQEIGVIGDMREIEANTKSNNHLRTLKREYSNTGNISFGLVLMIIGLLSLSSILLYYFLTKSN